MALDFTLESLDTCIDLIDKLPIDEDALGIETENGIPLRDKLKATSTLTELRERLEDIHDDVFRMQGLLEDCAEQLMKHVNTESPVVRNVPSMEDTNETRTDAGDS